MEPTQSRLLELLREVHLLAVKEVERLNLRVDELESLQRQSQRKQDVSGERLLPPPAIPKTDSVRKAEMMNEHEVAEHLHVSVSILRRWRLVRNGPKYIKVGRLVRYKRTDVEAWLESCPSFS